MKFVSILFVILSLKFNICVAQKITSLTRVSETINIKKTDIISVSKNTFQKNIKIIQNDKVLLEFQKPEIAPNIHDEYEFNITNEKFSALNKENTFSIILDDDKTYFFNFNKSTPPSSDSKNKVDIEHINNKTLFSYTFGANILNDAKILNITQNDLIAEDNDYLINNKLNLSTIKDKILVGYNLDANNVNSLPFFSNVKTGDVQNKRPPGYNTKSNIAKTDVTNIASGMARFLAERAKAELNESFFFYMHSQMEKVPELQFYFPQSYTVLKEIKKQNGNLNLEQLKTYFEQDIHKLPKNFYLTTQQKSFPVGSHLYTINNYLKNDANGQWIDYGLQVVFENDSKINPKELLHGFVHSDARKKLESKLTKETDKNLLNTIKLAELVSNSLLSPEANRYWVSQEDINELLSNEALFQTYIGLLLAKSNFDEYRIAFNGTDLKTIIEGKYTANGSIKDLKKLKNLVKGLYNSYVDVDKAVAEITENKNNFNPENLYRVYNVLNDNINVITTQINDNKILKSNITVDDSYFKNYINPAIDIAYNMSSKKYNVAIKGFINLLENSVNNEYITDINTIINSTDSLETLKTPQIAKVLVTKYLINQDNITELNIILKNKMPKYFECINSKEKLDQLYLLYKLVNEIDTENVNEIKKIILERKEVQNYLEDIKTPQLENLFTFINDNNSEIESLIYIAQNYNLNDPNIKIAEVIINHYLTNIDNDTFIIILKELKSNKKFHKHVKKYSKDYNNFMSKFATYGTLIANVSMAQNSDEVKDAISASVLPVGSSRMKRHADWSITLNAYVGGFAGRAYFKDYNGTAYENKSIVTFGVTAPIGISFNKGRMPFFGSKSTMGLTLQVVDLGSLVNFYAQKGDGAALPRDTKIELGDIIAPGGFLSYSIGDTPFTLMGGVQYVPNLSRMETIPTNAEFKPLTWRFHVGIAIDIPLFNLKVWN